MGNRLTGSRDARPVRPLKQTCACTWKFALNGRTNRTSLLLHSQIASLCGWNKTHYQAACFQTAKDLEEEKR